MRSIKYTFLLQRTATILSIATLTLAVVAATSGILIGFFYQPAAGDAYKSLVEITQGVSYGWLVYNLHDLAGNGIIAVALIQIIVLFLGRQFRPSWLTAWISGILLTLTTIGLGWTAMILRWNQLGYWRLKVELGTIATIPLIGKTIEKILTGGGGINTTTIVHFYDLHSYILPLAAIAMAVFHLGALVMQEQPKGLLILQLEKLVSPILKQLQETRVEKTNRIEEINS